MSKPATSFTAQEMLLYRDQIIHSLKAQLDLFETMQKQGLFDADSGIFTKQNYPEKISIIEEEIKKLENFDVVLAVVGTMKAGKSTTINAIVGHEILPNRNRPMTALPTLIYHTPNQSTPKLTFHNPKVNEFVKNLQQLLQQNPTWHNNQELGTDEMQALINKIIKGWIFEKAYEGEEKIFEFLADLNDLVRLSETLCRNYQEHENKLLFPFNECKNIDQLPKIEVAFRYLSDMKENQGRLILLDTPGPNEAGQTHLRTMLTEQLQRCSAVLLVLDYTQLKSEASQEVKEQLEEKALKTIQPDRLFVLVNKFDQRTVNGDNEEQIKQLILNDFLKDRVEPEHIFPLAAQHAFLANRMATELEINGKPDWDEKSWMSDFVKSACGTAAGKNKWDKKDIDDIKDDISDLLAASSIQAPLEAAIVKTQLEAPRIAMQATLMKLTESDIFKQLHEDLKNIFELLEEIGSKTQGELGQLEYTLKKLEQYPKELSRLQEKVNIQLKMTGQKETKKIKNAFQTLQNDLFTKTEKLFKGKIQELQEEITQQATLIRGRLVVPTHLRSMLYALQHLTKLKQGEEITLENEQERNRFNSNLQEMYIGLTQYASAEIDEMIQIGMTSIRLELTDIEKQVQEEILNKIEKTFLKGKIHLKLTVPDIKAIPVFKLKPISFTDQFERKLRTTPVDKNDWRSWFGFSGYKEKTLNTFIIKRKLIKKDFEEGLQSDFLRQAQQRINHIFDLSDDEWEKNYINKVEKRICELLDEAYKQIEKKTQQKNKKEHILERSTNIAQLKKRNQNIWEDIIKVRDKFLN